MYFPRVVRSASSACSLLLALAGLLLFAAAPAPVEAASFTIDSTTDAIDANPGDGVCATAPLPGEGARCTLRATVMETNVLGGEHTLTLPAGQFLLTFTGAGEDNGLTGDLDVNSRLTIQGV